MSKIANKIDIRRCAAQPELQGINYGFFTRTGGVSPAPYDSLNLGLGSDDAQENVIENRRRAAAAFGGVPESQLCILYQIHSNKVVRVDAAFSRDARPEGDAMVTATEGLMLGVLTADCGPVLFADETQRVIGAAHAGWRGALGGVLENTVFEMEALGAKRNCITAFIGPCIHQPSYEVDQNFKDQFTRQQSDYAAFFVPSPTKDGHHQFDLPRFITHRLAQMKLGAIHPLPLDTYQEEDLFFSYRRNTHRAIKGYGRGLSAVMLG